MKKIGMILLIILLMCFAPSVYAAEGVGIESVTVDSKSTGTVIVNPATFEGLSLKSDVKFNNVDDYVKYKLVIKNDTATDYELTESTSSSSYITYEYSYDDGNKVLTANSSKTMFITIKYSSSVPASEFTAGNYTETKSITINLDTGTDEITVPSTIDGLYCYLVLLIGTLVFAIALFKATNNKRYLTLVLVSMVLIPLNIHAIEKLKLTIESKVEITNPSGVVPTIYWAIQENGTCEAYDIVTDSFVSSTAYKFVIADSEQDGVHSGSFASNTEFSTFGDNPWLTDDHLFEYVTEVKVIGQVAPVSTAYWFISFGDLVKDEINFDLANLDTSNVTNMDSMFNMAAISTSTLNLDLSGWNTSSVTSMSRMFGMTGSNSTSFNLNLSGWDTSNVEDMSYMFYETAHYANSFNLDISGWNTSKVEDMEDMFFNVAINTTERTFVLPATNGNGISNTSTIIYGVDESVFGNTDAQQVTL